MYKVLFLSLICLGSFAEFGYAYRVGASQCDTDGITQPSGTTFVEEYCEVTEEAPATIATGQEVWVSHYQKSGYCGAPSCNNPEIAAESPIEATVATSTTFTNSLTHNVTGAIQGGSFIGGIQASLAIAVGGADGVSVTVSASQTVPDIHPCTWFDFYSKLKTIRGKKIEITAMVQSKKTWISSGITVPSSGATVEGTVTCTADVAVTGSGISDIGGGYACPIPQ